MEPKEFSPLLEHAFLTEADAHHLRYPEGGAAAWARVGASYLAFALCGLKPAQLRSVQSYARDTFGPVILDCKWYDRLKQICLDGKETVQALLPGPDGTLCECQVTESLFLEMLDFCREG